MTAESLRVNTKAALFCCAAGDAKLETNPLGERAESTNSTDTRRKAETTIKITGCLASTAVNYEFSRRKHLCDEHVLGT
jgi:hypothetical protein